MGAAAARGESAATAKPLFDVAVCTLNRLPYLRRCLAALRAQLDELPGGRLLVIDNGSSDGSAEYVRELGRRDPRVELVQEPRRGVYYARARAVDAARGDFLIFFDDDALPEPGWLRAMLEELGADPAVGVVGVAIEPIFEAPPPGWLAGRLLRDLPVYEVDGERVPGRFPAYPAGICLGLRVRDCLALYVHPARRRDYPLGRKESSAECGGEAMIGCEDTDLCEIYRRNGYRVLFSRRVRVRHAVPADRMVPDWFVRKFRSDGHARIRLLRLAGYPVVGRHSLAMLLGLPVFGALALLAPLLRGRARVLTLAYSAKCRGAWRELLLGPRVAALPYSLG
jgi:glycosyltransferase involved in cell wall biosynthesis